MILQSQAIAIRISPFSNTSHVVSWLTPDHGRLATVIKGARRPKSRFLGQYDQFYTCELLFYEKHQNNLHIAKECAPTKLRTPFRSDWRLAACASYLCDLTWRVSRENLPQPGIYTLLDTTLDFLASSTTVNAHIPIWYELHLLGWLGIAPHFNSCVLCRGSLPPNRFSLSIHAGGTVCHNCVANRAEPVSEVSPATLAMLRHWQNSQTPRVALNTRTAQPIAREASATLLKLLNYHLDMHSKARSIALDLITNSPSTSATPSSSITQH